MSFPTNNPSSRLFRNMNSTVDSRAEYQRIMEERRALAKQYAEQKRRMHEQRQLNARTGGVLPPGNKTINMQTPPINPSDWQVPDYPSVPIRHTSGGVEIDSVNIGQSLYAPHCRCEYQGERPYCHCKFRVVGQNGDDNYPRGMPNQEGPKNNGVLTSGPSHEQYNNRGNSLEDVILTSMNDDPLSYEDGVAISGGQVINGVRNNGLRNTTLERSNDMNDVVYNSEHEKNVINRDDNRNNAPNRGAPNLNPNSNGGLRIATNGVMTTVNGYYPEEERAFAKEHESYTSNSAGW